MFNIYLKIIKMINEKCLGDNSIPDKICNSDYNFFTVKGFFGFNDGIRLVKLIYIFISFILNLLIVISLSKRKKKQNSIALVLTGNILLINFIHTFTYILNWVTNLDNPYKMEYNNKNYKVGGLLIGNPTHNYFVCKLQGFMLLYSSLSQDISIIIFFYSINMSTVPSKLKIYTILLGIGHFLPFFYSTICAIIDGIGLNDRYCYIKKFEFTNPSYKIYKYFSCLIIITYSMRAINLSISVYLLIKINKYVKKHKFRNLYIFKTYFLLILQVITTSIGFIYRISHLIANDNNKGFSNAFLCINTIDGILFPLSYSLSNGIYTNLFCKNNINNESLNSLFSDDNENKNCIIDDTYSTSSHRSSDDKTFALIDVKDDNNFDLSYSG